MLSRFSRLPGISSFLSATPDYPREIIDKAVAEIKFLGKNTTSSNDDMLQSIKRILALMKKYSDTLQVQRVSCHALSNLAMQVVIARWIVKEGGFGLILKALTKFESDHKLCWLGSSAIWNLARPPANRGTIGTDGVQLMLRMLRLHRSREKVTNTCIGALSNLSLHNNLKDAIAEPDNVDLVLDVLSQYASKKALSVMTSGAGLLANLAVSDDHASVLVERLCLPILLQLLTWKDPSHADTADLDSGKNKNSSGNDDNHSSMSLVYPLQNESTPTDRLNDTLYRNTCAALNNMVTANSFLEAFLCSRGVEIITDFLDNNENELYSNLLENCLINVEVDASTRTTSLHLCALHGRLSILQTLLQCPSPSSSSSREPQNSTVSSTADLDETDSKNMTTLDYAISMGHYDVIRFLCKCGAVKYQQSLVDNQAIMEKDGDKKTTDAINGGMETLQQVLRSNEKAIYTSVPELSMDLCKLITEQFSAVDMLKGVNSFF